MELQIGKIIMQTRREKGMTQETLADMVGVSAAAVSKWETCASYPDITLLPPLARALGLSVDALLDFRRDPAREEQLAISSRLHQVFDDQGFDAGVRAVEAVLREYPHSGSIKLLAGALYYRYIAAALNRAEDTEQTASDITERCLALFEQGEQQSEETGEKQVSRSLRISMLTMLGRYEETEAEQLARRALLTHVGEVSTALMSLTTIARRQKAFAAAHRLVDAYRAVDALFGLDRSNGLLLGIMLAQDEGDQAQALDLFEQYIDTRLAYTLDYRDNPFFAAVQTHVPTRNDIIETHRLTLRAIEEDERYAPLRDEPRFQAALDRLRAAIPAEN